MEAVKLLFLAIAAAVGYGILHDQVTARVCVEYFTIGHPRIIASEEPTILAFVWGTLATWWVGLLLGLPLVVVCRAGKRPGLTARDVRPAVVTLLALMAFTSLVAGCCGYLLSRAGAIRLQGWLAARLPLEKHDRFLADAWAHAAAYGMGFLGGTAVLCWLWSKRRRRVRLGAARADALC
ncbi:MAG: hypothetical protein JNM56_13085 [Planctomycetia bacterium]|nr:hypothetical protein [Planctomycetia bacterium]